MAEGEKKVYLTRSRKRSIDCLENHHEVVSVHEATADIVDLTREDSCTTKEVSNSLECAICLQNCVHPARLPCGHIFCFLCVKGAAHGNKKCAMCRSPIPHDYFNNPELLETPEELSDTNQEGYEWFYEGRHGWWQYDPRTTKEIEYAWKTDLNQCELLIAGYLYIIDLQDMCQIRKGQPLKRRKIKRDLASSEKLGIAGIRDPNAPLMSYSEDNKREDVDDDDEVYSDPEDYFAAELRSSRFIEEAFHSLTINTYDEDDDDADYQ